MINMARLTSVYKTHARIAQVCGVTTQAVTRWARTGEVPLCQQYRLKYTLDPERFSRDRIVDK
jgi:hypothetical protein